MGSDEKYASLAEVQPGSQIRFGNNKGEVPATASSDNRAVKFDEIRRRAEASAKSKQEVESY